jgi:hypothetical protein
MSWPAEEELEDAIGRQAASAAKRQLKEHRYTTVLQACVARARDAVLKELPEGCSVRSEVADLQRSEDKYNTSLAVGIPECTIFSIDLNNGNALTFGVGSNMWGDNYPKPTWYVHAAAEGFRKADSLLLPSNHEKFRKTRSTEDVYHVQKRLPVVTPGLYEALNRTIYLRGYAYQSYWSLVEDGEDLGFKGTVDSVWEAAWNEGRERDTYMPIERREVIVVRYVVSDGRGAGAA